MSAGTPGRGADEPRVQGPPGAPLIVLHADFSCPDCAMAWRRIEPLALQVDLRHFVLRARGVPARRAALAAEAAAEQGQFWPFAQALLQEPGRQELPDLWALAERRGLEGDRFVADLKAESGADRIAAETRAALAGGAGAVPTIFADAPTADFLAQSGYDGEVRIRSKK